MQSGETAWNPTGVGKVSLCAGLHGVRWSHRVVEIFQDLYMSTITSVCRAARWSLVPFRTSTITCAVKCVVIRSAVQPGPED